MAPDYPSRLQSLSKTSFKGKGQIHFYDIGDYLERKQKLSLIENFKSIEGIKAKAGFKQIEPDEENDWVNQGDRAYYDFISLE